MLQEQDGCDRGRVYSQLHQDVWKNYTYHLRDTRMSGTTVDRRAIDTTSFLDVRVLSKAYDNKDTPESVSQRVDGI